MGLVTLTQAAASLGLVARGLRIQAERGRLRAQKLGRDWVVESAEVERYRREVLGTHPGRRPAEAGRAEPGRPGRAGRTRMEPARKERPKTDSLAQKSDGIAKVSGANEPPDLDSRLPQMSDRNPILFRPVPKPSKKKR